jgi:ABC-type multidrug transport system fused ATPase/permease subunit
VRLSTKNGLDNIQTKVAYTTRVKGFERLLDFSIKWHDKENTGNKVQKIQNGTGALKDLQRMLSNDVYYELTTIIGVLFAFVFSSPILLAIAFLYLTCFLAVQQRFYKVMVELNDKYNQLIEEASGTYYEGLSNVLTIKTLGVQKRF